MIHYERDLNPAQLEAVTTLDGPVLVIAGAGSGKTRTIVYRLARLVESGVPAAQILLLTFTRKAAHEMLERARLLLGHQALSANGDRSGLAALAAVQGGTFHAYAYSVLRLFRPEGYNTGLTVMDSHDILAALQHCREEVKAGKGDRSFPKNQTINGLLSKSRNKEIALEDVLRRDAVHLLPHAESMARMADAYAEYKRTKNLLDYDDLLFGLEEVLRTRPEALAWCRNKHRYIMVDEYQDTNQVQARIAALVAGLDPEQPSDDARASVFSGNIMAVGDDAQSIYAFRGADVRNILRFPEIFTGAKLIRLEENYRATQPLLDLSNNVLAHAGEGFAKRLFTRREGGRQPDLLRPLSDRSQAAMVAGRIAELLSLYNPSDIAVLFRAGFHSYALEIALNKIGVRFRKYGGIRYTEAAHVKDAMAFVRLVLNPLDYTAFARMAELAKGVGPKTCLKIYQCAAAGDGTALEKALGRHPDLAADLAFVEDARRTQPRPAALLTSVIEHYAPRLELLYPDDYPRRRQGLEQLLQIAAAYDDLDVMAADLSLEDPGGEQERGDEVVLSTIHSAKGLEWSVVIVIDLVEERFPSRHAMVRPEDYEEERRLMYVACTRARDRLYLSVPASMYDKGTGGSIPAVPSPFVRELPANLYTEWQEGYGGLVVEKKRPDFTERAAPEARSQRPTAAPSDCGFCRHRIFGRGKIVQHIPPDKVRVNFPGVGLKVIMAAYLSMED
ncbi:ATP-dependent helicase [Desulfovibrio sp. OttesenSCG-928-M16]|nr:ATP-dependent helicase [Desulfovibrio sp. OttesenSCG-928-M16]